MRRFDVMRMAASLLPVVLRRPVVCSILHSALSVLQGHHDTLDTEQNGEPWGVVYRLRHTGQVCSLESLLNDRFDAELRRIEVNGGGDGSGACHLYSDAEIRLQEWLVRWLGTMVLGDGTAVRPVEGDFVVSVPRELASHEAGIRASLDDMKVAGTVYVIVYFQG